MSHIVLYYHIVWRTKRSERTLTSSDELYRYIWGYCKRKECKLIRIGGVEDHLHMLVSIRPDIAVSDFMRVLKGETSKWLGERKDLCPAFKGWANGYAAFSYCERDREMIINYINGQKEHHRHTTFQEEYEQMLRAWGLKPEEDLFLRD